MALCKFRPETNLPLGQTAEGFKRLKRALGPVALADLKSSLLQVKRFPVKRFSYYRKLSCYYSSNGLQH